MRFRSRQMRWGQGLRLWWCCWSKSDQNERSWSLNWDVEDERMGQALQWFHYGGVIIFRITRESHLHLIILTKDDGSQFVFNLIFTRTLTVQESFIRRDATDWRRWMSFGRTRVSDSGCIPAQNVINCLPLLTGTARCGPVPRLPRIRARKLLIRSQLGARSTDFVVAWTIFKELRSVLAEWLNWTALTHCRQWTELAQQRTWSIRWWTGTASRNPATRKRRERARQRLNWYGEIEGRWIALCRMAWGEPGGSLFKSCPLEPL